MDQKEFERLQTAVQWAYDEEDVATPSLTLNMDAWGFGKVSRTHPAFRARYSTDTKPIIEVKVVCPTACCLAGNIVLAAGDQFVVNSQYHHGEVVYADYCVDEKGVIYSIPVRALELIGLDDDGCLFDSNQSAAQVIERATALAERHGYELDIK